MNLNPPHVLAGDTNVSIDLAQGCEWVLDALSTIRRRLPDSSLLVPPTVSEELAWLADHAEETAERQAARKFLREHRTWGFRLLHTVPLGDLYVAKIAERLLQASLLPASESNDAQILAESAALGCSVLLTSDDHLRGVDFHSLAFELAPFELVAPVIATPREIVRKFFQ
jgi:predicted nucleic acid-binding protein